MTLEDTATIGPFITNRFGDRYLYEVNRNTFNQIGSEALFHKQYGASLWQKNRLYLFAGSDSGLLLRYLLKNELPIGTRYIFIELPSVLEALRKEGLLDDLPQQVAVIEANDLRTQAETYQFQNYVYIESAEMRESFAAIDGHIGAYRELSEATLNWMRRETYGISANIGVANFIVKQLENLSENRLPAALLNGAFKGKTAVLLAGGPSLDEILPWVKQNRDRLIILAVSRISGNLLAEGLFPHFIVTVDPQEISFEISREMLQLHEKSILVHAYHASPLLVSQWQGRSFYLGSLFPWTTPLNDTNIPVSGPTVTNSALSLAMAMGCAQIVLAGVDLCFNRHGFTHASGSSETRVGPLLGATSLRVETNDGGWADTASGYRSAIDILDFQSGFARSKNCRIINPARGAAKIKNVEHLSLDSIEIPSTQESPLETAFSLMPDENSEQRTEYYRKLLDELGRAERSLKKLSSLAQEALICNDGLFGRKGKKADFKYKLRMDKIEGEINTKFCDFSSCVKQYGIHGFLKMTRPDKNQEWADSDIELAGRIYYESYRDSSQDLRDLVISAAERVKARLEEENTSPDVELLVAQWQKDGQPGRYHVWKNRCLENGAEYPDGMRKHEAKLNQDFLSLLNNVDTGHLKKIKKGRDLSLVRGKALALFQRTDSEGLRLLLEGLEKHPDQSSASPLISLVHGYLAELEGDVDLALDAYQSLIGETFNILTEDALRRIGSLCIEQGNLELAQLALECLKNGAVSYHPQYAEFLRLTGNLQDAADVYVSYLEKVPGDLAAVLKLGQIYRSMGHEKEARQVFQLVIEEDPANRAAQTLLKENISNA